MVTIAHILVGRTSVFVSNFAHAEKTEEDEARGTFAVLV